ncbi:hypothetical protein GKQ38_05280 [Candidatus Nanohaloarchaea archaeon]|nr:hypothetical protein GKQ38_05280 [Candidatus Nanohaloarchaea archaeon]
MEGLCDYCQEKKAVTSCEVCGSKVCQDHKKEHGCAVCNGGERTFE